VYCGNEPLEFSNLQVFSLGIPADTFSQRFTVQPLLDDWKNGRFITRPQLGCDPKNQSGSMWQRRAFLQCREHNDASNCIGTEFTPFLQKLVLVFGFFEVAKIANGKVQRIIDGRS